VWYSNRALTLGIGTALRLPPQTVDRGGLSTIRRTSVRSSGRGCFLLRGAPPGCAQSRRTKRREVVAKDLEEWFSKIRKNRKGEQDQRAEGKPDLLLALKKEPARVSSRPGG